MSFDDLIGSVDFPMFIVTTRAGDERSGCLVGFACQVSIEPRRFLACISELNRTFRVVQDATHVAVHLVGADDMALAELFGGESGDDVDKFSLCEWDVGPHGMPLLRGAPSRFVGRIVERYSLGDHMGLLLDPEEVAFAGEEPELTSSQAEAIEPGHPVNE